MTSTAESENALTLQQVAATDPLLADLLEKRARRDVRQSLDAWAKQCGWIPARHHSFINGMLEKVEAGKIRKLIVCVPPGSAKSTYTSVQFPPWYLGKQPGRGILACSHRDDLVTSFGRRGRELINSHGRTLGYKLAKHSQAADRWETSNGGIYQGAGIGAGIAGIRADLGLIDDFFGKKEDADSKLMRDKLWDWYKWDFMRRLKPNAAQVIMNTRWHEDDLIGRLLASEANEWVVIDIPLYARENDPLGRAVGEPLWPEYFNEDFRREAQKDARIYNCAFQNNPIPESGNYFEKAWIQEYSPSELPKELRYYAASDHAVSQKQEADSSVMLVAGVSANDDIYILPDAEWDKFPTDIAVTKMLALNKKYHPISWWAGKEHITQSIGPFLNKEMAVQRNYIALVETPSIRDLSTRAQPIKARMRSRKVFFPRWASWWPVALHELLSFPVGTHDDFIAALSELGRGLDEMIKPPPPPAEDVKHTDMVNKPWRPTIKWMKESEKAKLREQQLVNADR